MSFPAGDGGEPVPPPWHPALVIFLLNKETGCLTSGGDLGPTHSLRLGNIFASGDRWPITLHPPDLWPQRHCTHDTRLLMLCHPSPLTCHRTQSAQLPGQLQSNVAGSKYAWPRHGPACFPAQLDVTKLFSAASLVF